MYIRRGPILRCSITVDQSVERSTTGTLRASTAPPAVGHGAPGAPGTTPGVSDTRMPAFGHADVWHAQSRPRGPRSTIAHRREGVPATNGDAPPGMGADEGVDAQDMASTGRRGTAPRGISSDGQGALHRPRVALRRTTRGPAAGMEERGEQGAQEYFDIVSFPRTSTYDNGQVDISDVRLRTRAGTRCTCRDSMGGA
jgi:hypothetical protein